MLKIEVPTKNALKNSGSILPNQLEKQPTNIYACKFNSVPNEITTTTLHLFVLPAVKIKETRDDLHETDIAFTYRQFLIFF